MLFLILLYCQVLCYLDVYDLLHKVFAHFFFIQHAVTVDRIITTARQIGIIIFIGISADFSGASVFCEIVENFFPEFEGVVVESVEGLVGALLEMIVPPVVTLIVRS